MYAHAYCEYRDMCKHQHTHTAIPDQRSPQERLKANLTVFGPPRKQVTKGNDRETATLKVGIRAHIHTFLASLPKYVQHAYLDMCLHILSLSIEVCVYVCLEVCMHIISLNIGVCVYVYLKICMHILSLKFGVCVYVSLRFVCTYLIWNPSYVYTYFVND